MKFEEVAKGFVREELLDSEVKLTGEVPAETIASYRDRALKSISAEITIHGFRKGHVPANIIQKKIGEVAILEEAVKFFMRDFYPELIDFHKVDAVGRPEVGIIKIAPGNPVGLTVRATIYPVVMIPNNWKVIASKVEIETIPDILDAEVDEALEQIRKSQAEAKCAVGIEERHEGHELPDLDDAFAQALGQFADLADLKTKLRANIKLEKEQKIKEKRRGKIIDLLLEKIKVSIPKIFVESELEKILSQLREDISRFGMTLEAYLAKSGKTEETVRNEFRDQATKRAKLQIVLNKLADQEKIVADPDVIEAEIKIALEHFPKARHDLVRIHIETVIRNERVLELLEKGE